MTTKDITGMKFHSWTVVSFHSKGKNSKWNCICECGTERIISRQHLKKGTVSCGCKRFIENLPSMNFGKLKVIKIHSKERNSKWLCVCECGKEVIRSRTYLLVSKNLSCGCQRKKPDLTNRKKSLTNKKHITHGKTESYSYKTWCYMKQRCLNKKNVAYPRWGGRGIIICERWINSFENFLEDMGEREPGMSIERIDNEKGYSKENCKWATQAEQNKNTRRNVFIYIDGEKFTARDAWIKMGKIGCEKTFRIKNRNKNLVTGNK